MNKSQFRDEETDEPGILDLHIKFAIGGSGAVGAKTYGRCFGTPVRNSAGNYTLPMIEGVNDIVGVYLQVRQAVIAATTGETITPTVLTPSGAAPLVTIQCKRQDTGAATDPASGDFIQGFIRVKNSSA